MRNLVAKFLRKEAFAEMVRDGVPKRDLVMGKNSVVNSPRSVRAMYLKLKAAFKKVRATVDEAAAVVTRTRKRSGFHRRADLTRGPATIQSPLKQLHALFPATQNERGNWIENPIYVKAARAAKYGHGDTVMRIARQYV